MIFPSPQARPGRTPGDESSTSQRSPRRSRQLELCAVDLRVLLASPQVFERKPRAALHFATWLASSDPRASLPGTETPQGLKSLSRVRSRRSHASSSRSSCLHRPNTSTRTEECSRLCSVENASDARLRVRYVGEGERRREKRAGPRTAQDGDTFSRSGDRDVQEPRVDSDLLGALVV